MFHISDLCGLADMRDEQRIRLQKADGYDGYMDKAAFQHRHIDTVNLLTIRGAWLCLPGKIDALTKDNCKRFLVYFRKYSAM